MRSFNLLFVVVVAAVFCAAYGKNDTCRSGPTYDIDESTMTMTIHGAGMKGVFEDCTPSEYKSVKTVVLEGEYTKIGKEVFKEWTSLTTVTLPDTMQSLDDYAFRGSGLTSFHVGKSFFIWNTFAFMDCQKLAKFTVDAENEKFTVVDDILFEKDKKTIVRYPPAKAGSSYTIPSDVTKIAGGCFQASFLKNVIIPEGLETIGEYSLHGMPNIKSIIIPASVNKIERFSFARDFILEYVRYLGTSDPKSGSQEIFSNCPKLDKVCVEANYSSSKFCMRDITTTCGEPPGDDSSSGAGSGSGSPSAASKGSSTASSTSSSVVNVPLVASVVLAVVFCLLL